MTDALTLAGDSGTRRITMSQLFTLPPEAADKVEGILIAEAQKRHLEVNIQRDLATDDIIVSWRPDTPRTGDIGNE